MNYEFYLQEGMSCTVYGEGMSLKEAMDSIKRKGGKEIIRVLHLNNKIEICWR